MERRDRDRAPTQGHLPAGRPRRARTTALPLACALALGAGACTDDAGPAATSPPPSAPSAPAAPPPPGGATTPPPAGAPPAAPKPAGSPGAPGATGARPAGPPGPGPGGPGPGEAAADDLPALDPLPDDDPELEPWRREPR